MIGDARKLQADQQLETDVVVVGSGPAGLCFAEKLAGSGLSTLVLESGGEAPDPETSKLSEGLSVGQRYPNLASTRVRSLGGTSHHWAGMCVPLDPSDFESRDWVPHSGWPFAESELAPFYRQAHRMLGLGRYDYSAKPWAKARKPLPLGARSRLSSGVFQVAQHKRRMAPMWRSLVAKEQGVRVLLHANLTRVQLNESAGAVHQLHCQVLGGQKFFVRARYYVLAAGGLENARLLLASNGEQTAGIGNQHDQLGRYFMEHPHVDNYGLLAASANMPDAGFYSSHQPRGGRGFAIWGFLELRRELRRREKLLSAHVVLPPLRSIQRQLQQRKMGEGLETIHAMLGEQYGGSPEQAYGFGTPSEQSPNPSSRITLSDQVDALGMPRLQLDWRLSPLDLRTLRRTHELMALEFGQRGWGRVRLGIGDEWPALTGWGYHHMGSTRMHRDPKQGVCDAYGRVHGVLNLMVAGSSLFPTSGSANPTLTLMALALRQAQWLKSKLS